MTKKHGIPHKPTSRESVDAKVGKFYGRDDVDIRFRGKSGSKIYKRQQLGRVGL